MNHPQFKPGDIVTQKSGRWIEGDKRVIDHVNSELFPDDPFAFFVGGGFWRVSHLRYFHSNDAPEFSVPSVP